MSEHTVTVTGFTEKSGGNMRGQAATIGQILVRPPFTVGKEFGRTVVGREATGAQVSEVVSTDDATVLFAEVTTSHQDRSAQVHRVAERVQRLLNNPEQALAMMNESPFIIEEQFGPGDVSGWIGR